MTFICALSINFLKPLCHKHLHACTHTHTVSGFTNTPSRLAFPPPNQFATLLSETLFNVPQLFLWPLLFNTLLYYPLISPFLFPVSLAPFICFEQSAARPLWIFTSRFADSSRQVIWATWTQCKQPQRGSNTSDCRKRQSYALAYMHWRTAPFSFLPCWHYRLRIENNWTVTHHLHELS